MKIGIDISELNTLNQIRGIGFYVENLINALREYTKHDVLVIDKKHTNQNIDVLHFPYLDLFRATLPIKTRQPTVVTIHDVIPLVFPRHYPPGLKGRVNFLRQKFALLATDAVITDSESSKKDIARYLKYKISKIYTVYLAQGKNFQRINSRKKLWEVTNKYHLPESFALYVGDVNWNKNILNLTEACMRAEVDLVIVGKSFVNWGNLNHIEMQALKSWLKKYSGNPRIYTIGYVPETDLVSLYNLAKVFLLPSYYEGFGLPVLEAQACGTPVITSNTSSLPEIAGKGAIFIDPNDVDTISLAIKDLVSNDQLREKLIQAGFENVQKFQWKKTAQQTVDIYERILR